MATNIPAAITEVIQRVSAARSIPGETSLFGFGLRGIQDMVLTSTRQGAIRGASRLVNDFGSQHFGHGTSIVATGGHGVLLVPSVAVEAVNQAARQHVRDKLPLAELNTFAVPFRADAEDLSLIALRTVQEATTESAPRYVFALPGTAPTCENCYERGSSTTRRWPSRRGETSEHPICYECDLFFKADKSQNTSPLSEIAQDGRVAMISADGNQVGSSFDACKSLEDLALLSAAVSSTFADALDCAEASLSPNGQADPKARLLNTFSGGDDVRLFIGPRGVDPFVRSFVLCFEATTEAWSTALQVTHPRIAPVLKELGVGIGVAVADEKFPARRLGEIAKLMERRAKQLRPEGQARPARFTIDIAFLKTGNELDEGELPVETAMSISGKAKKVRGVLRWEDTCSRAQALLRVPTNQVAQVVRASADEATFMNFLGYQVARSASWKGYYAEIGLDWRDPYELKYGAPDRSLLNLTSLFRKAATTEKNA